MFDVGEDNGLYVRSDGTFIAFCPDGLMLKSEQKQGDTKYYPFTGIASTPDKDRDKEVILQKGLDFSPFMEHGDFNWNHIPHATVGVPWGKKAWFQDGKWFSEGRIIKGLPIWEGYSTDMVIQQHTQLRKAGTNRGLCQSIEGKVMERSPCGRYVQKAVVYNIALTFRPVNPNCTVSVLAKSLMKQMPVLCRDEFYEKAFSPLASVTSTSLEDGLVEHAMSKYGDNHDQARLRVQNYLASKFG